MQKSPLSNYLSVLQELKEKDNCRKLPGKEASILLDLSSNDYLGINSNELLRNDFLNTHAGAYAFSASSSRLLGKGHKEHAHLENLIARMYHKEAALLFNSGYHANVGILSALPTSKDLIIADKQIHASIIDGARLSKANFIRYKHLDYRHLNDLLNKHRHDYEQVFIVSESIFSMDGDVADIGELVTLKQAHQCFLCIDEAHALGVRGKRGLGCVEETGSISHVDFIVGTMGKALASVGAFVACQNVFKDYLINHARPFIYSTALPPINMAWSRFILKKITDMRSERKKLNELAKLFASMLGVQAHSHIIPYIVGENADAVRLSKCLTQGGFNVLPIRHPTVRKHTARLRFSLNATMDMELLHPIGKLLSLPVKISN